MIPTLNTTQISVEDQPQIAPPTENVPPKEPHLTLAQLSSDIASLIKQIQAKTAPPTIAPPERPNSSPKNEQNSSVDSGEPFEFLNMVGAGSYGTVFKARDRQNGRLVALKKIKTDSQRDGFPVTALREIKILQSLRHENVVPLREMVIRKGTVGTLHQEPNS